MGIPYHEIIFREKGDYRKDYAFKLEALEKLMDRYRIEVVYDDSLKFIEEVRRRYPQIKTYLVKMESSRK